MSTQFDQRNQRVDTQFNVVYQLASTEGQDLANLAILRDKVRRFWIDGVLDHSLQNGAPIKLRKEHCPCEVVHPWEMHIEIPEGVWKAFSEDAEIVEIFEASGRTLLILGAPGSGKTTTLLELTRELIEQSSQDSSRAVPVVFNLSAWKRTQSDFNRWMIEELRSKYMIPRRISRTWLENMRILPMLDGFDEVAAVDRAACLDSIDAVTKKGLPGMVLCSRSKEYRELPRKIGFCGAICLQPLDDKQIERYLTASGKKLGALQDLLARDSILRELSRNPLMLGIMPTIYDDTPASDMVAHRNDRLEDRRQQLLAMYVDRMFRGKGKREKPYPRVKVEKWLSWLASNMLERGTSVFYAEDLQPSWLDNVWEKVAYFVVLRSALAFLYAAIGFLTVAVVSPTTAGDVGLWLFVGSLLYLHLDIVRLLALCVLLALALAVSLSQVFLAVTFSIKAFTFWFAIALVAGGALMREYRSKFNSMLQDELSFADKIGWSWRGAAIATVGTLLLLGMLAYIFESPEKVVENRRAELVEAVKAAESSDVASDRVIDAVVENFFLTIGLPFMDMIYNTVAFIIASNAILTAFLFSGLLQLVIDRKTQFNQGVRLSLRNAVFIVTGYPLYLLIGTYVLGTIGQELSRAAGIWGFFSQGKIIMDQFIFDASFFVSTILPVLALLGLLVAMVFSLSSVIGHYMLRCFLFLAGLSPLSLHRFLDYGVSCAFLRPAGGGYVFMHRYLLEHFAVLRRQSRP